MPQSVTVFTADQAMNFMLEVRRANPVVHCLTNDVVQAFTANVLLAVGACPAMVVAEEEAAHFAATADALLINVGTVRPEMASSMFLAASAARDHGRPWVLDPVAVGLLPYRAAVVAKLLPLRPTVIRGNAAEIMSLAGQNASAKGPDSCESSLNALDAAKSLALDQNCIVAVTGECDFITDGATTYTVQGGHKLLTLLTGVGCSLSAMTAAFAACSKNRMAAVAAACLMMKNAGELAAVQKGLGAFASALLDQLSFAAS
ncbi:hydroxyethylthiazole kinase [Desulfovibrio sp. OttesenSCG-928-F20]|nr:hydroxyethylthiazole kinase [Desulfovibrio sp. OttesenSCG-928-F20]